MKHANIIGLLNQPDSVKAPTEKMSEQIKFGMCLMKISVSILLIFLKNLHHRADHRCTHKKRAFRPDRNVDFFCLMV